MLKLKDGPPRAGKVLAFARVRQQKAPNVCPFAQQRIGMSLRAMYDELVEQPLPSRFVELLTRLDQGQQKS
jgi:hypothetical protein